MMSRLILLIALIFAPLSMAQAAVMSIAPSASSVAQGDIVTARLVVNSQGVAINNAEASLEFPSDILSVLSVSKSNSIFSLWVAEPSFSNGAGTVSFNGGIPNPGFTGSAGTVITVTFRANKAGTASLSLADAAVRANDGLGTNVLSGTSAAQITVTAPVAPVAPAAPATPAPTATPATPARGSVELSSPTHPDQNAWYANQNPTLTWNLPANADSVQVIADRSESATPSKTYTPAIVERTVSELADGTWYFNLRYRAGGAWSAVSSFRLNIDTSVPEITDAAFTYDEARRRLVLAVSATDEGSGIASYDVSIDGGEASAIPAEAFADGSYEMPFTRSGSHTIVLRAYDAAGNAAAAEGSFKVETSVMDTPVFELGGITVRLLPLLLIMVLISLLSLIAALIASYIAYRHLARPREGRAETREKVHRALLMLRSDLDKQVRALKKAKTGKELTAREELLSTSISENISDLERYLLDKTDLFK